MSEKEIVLYCLRLFFGGLCSFAAILLCAKRRSAGVVCLVAFVLLSYARSVYEILRSLGIILETGLDFFGMDALLLAFEIFPPLFLFLAMIFMIAKKI